MSTNFALSSEFRYSLGYGAVNLLLLLGISALLLDGGLTAQITLMVVLAYLGGLAVVAVRRPKTPTAADLWMLRWGAIPLWFAAQVAVRYAWTSP